MNSTQTFSIYLYKTSVFRHKGCKSERLVEVSSTSLLKLKAFLFIHTSLASIVRTGSNIAEC